MHPLLRTCTLSTGVLVIDGIIFVGGDALAIGDADGFDNLLQVL